jgi:hypothetical protein
VSLFFSLYLPSSYCEYRGSGFSHPRASYFANHIPVICPSGLSSQSKFIPDEFVFGLIIESTQRKCRPHSLPHANNTWGSRAAALCLSAGLTRCPARKPKFSIHGKFTLPKRCVSANCKGSLKALVIQKQNIRRNARWLLRPTRCSTKYKQQRIRFCYYSLNIIVALIRT